MTQYDMRFTELARHIVFLVPTDRERIRRSIYGLNYSLQYMDREHKTDASFNQMVEIARHLEHVCKLERDE